MKVIQITDCHIRSNENAVVYGVNPRKKLEQIINHISENNIKCDFMLLTGDISDDGSINSYEFVANLFQNINTNIYYINGNHDSKENLIKVFSKTKNLVHLNELNTEF